MTSNDGTAKIYDMQDARARRQASELPAADFENAGAHLRGVREASGLTIGDVAERIHLKPRHLEAIEQMQTDALPPRPYAIGFVKTYAEFLELDAGVLVERFKQDLGFSAPPKVEVEKFEASEKATAAEGGELSLMAVLAIIAFFIWCAWQIALLDGRKHDTANLGLPISGAAPSGRAILDPDATPDASVGEILEARIINRIDPIFPRTCMEGAGATETVVVSFNISATGRVVGERVAGSTNGCLDAPALNAVRRWEFEPRKVEGSARALYDQQAVFVFERPH